MSIINHIDQDLFKKKIKESAEKREKQEELLNKQANMLVQSSTFTSIIEDARELGSIYDILEKHNVPSRLFRRALLLVKPDAVLSKSDDWTSETYIQIEGVTFMLEAFLSIIPNESIQNEINIIQEIYSILDKIENSIKDNTLTEYFSTLEQAYIVKDFEALQKVYYDYPDNELMKKRNYLFVTNLECYDYTYDETTLETIERLRILDKRFQRDL